MAAPPKRFVERRYRQTNGGSGELPREGTLADFDSEPAVLVLGDPGAGKTTAFTRAASETAHAKYLKVGAFLEIPPERLAGQTLFIDALDEHRRRLDGGASSIDRVMGQLLKLGQPKFRLSCRAADWYGKSDEASLSEAVKDHKLCILQLLPLSDEDVVAIATAWGQDGAAFIRTAAERGVSDVLRNPLTLSLLLEEIQELGWPGNRAELFALGVRKLVQEQNPDHARANRNATEAAVLETAAGYVCAALLLSGQLGAALSPASVDKDFLDIRLLHALANHPGTEQPAIEAALGSRLFTSDGAERAVPMHRALAEYLGARFLAERVRQKGLPLRRVLALLEGMDGSPPTELRGLFAWLTTLLPKHANSLIPADPLGIILYGDASLLSHEQRVRVLTELERLESRHPWYRYEARNPEPFGNMVTPDMELVFRAILTEADRPPMLVVTVLDALAHGSPMPGLNDALLSLMRDNGRPEYLRARALEAFQHQAPGDTDSLRMLLDEINAGRVTDPDKQMRGQLIRSLYPTLLRPAEVLRYLVPEDPDDPIGSYHMTVEFHIPDNMAVDELPGFLDALAEHGPFPRREHRRTGERLIGNSIFRGLKCFGEREPASRIYHWLGPVQLEYMSTIDKEESEGIRAWFETHPAVFKDLLLYWLAQADPTERMDFAHYRDFQPRVQHARPPVDFTEWALEQAILETDDARAIFLFSQAVRAFYGSEKHHPESLAHLHAVATDHARFAGVMREMSTCPLDEHHWGWKVKHAKHLIERNQKRVRDVETWTARIGDIRNGTDVDDLVLFSGVYFGRFSDQPKSEDPIERLQTALGQQITDAALEGFVVALGKPDEMGLREIAHIDAQGKGMWTWYLPLVGIEELTKRDRDAVCALPEHVVRKTIAALLGTEVGNRIDHDWMRLLVRERCENVASALAEFWRIQLDQRRDHLPGVYALKEPWMHEVAHRIVPELLRDYPSCATNILESLLEAAIEHCDRGVLRDLTF